MSVLPNSNTGVSYSSVWGSGPNDVYVTLGTGLTASVVYRWDGSAWTQMAGANAVWVVKLVPARKLRAMRCRVRRVPRTRSTARPFSRPR
ncbi:MAG: hypothetical protein AB1938_30485, partial [Myxococcota bacterium]